MEHITWQGCRDLTSAILDTPPGDWTHNIPEGPVRFVKRFINPKGIERVAFRGEDYAGDWTAVSWDHNARHREPDPVQLTLF